MTATYEPISSVTLAANTATVTFSDIPDNFTDLIVIGRFGFQGGNVTELYCRFNSDAGSNYSTTDIYGTGSAVTSSRISNSSLGAMIAYSDSSAVSTFRLSIMSYANTSVYKTALGEVSSPGRVVSRNVSMWRATSAITSVSLSRNATGNDIVSGSTFFLYGVRAA